MESGVEETQKQRSTHYKNLRKQQKKRRKERKREEELKRQQQVRKIRFEKLVKKIREKGEKMQDPESEDLQLMDQSILVSDQKDCPTSRAKSAEHKLKEICVDSLVKLGKTIGSGTYGCCQLARYRSMTVVVKEFKSFRSGVADTERQRKAALHEANILCTLGDHPNLPLLFGVQIKKPPFCLVTQFHGDKEGSLTLWRAAPKLELSNYKWMNVTKMICGAIQYIHSQRVIHNDLKPNNVVLEKRESSFHPIVIDFGKSLKVEVAASASKCLSKESQRRHLKKYAYVAPELVNGGYPSFASDVYSFAKIIDFPRKEKSNLQLNSVQLTLAINRALSPDPTKRPELSELLEKF